MKPDIIGIVETQREKDSHVVFSEGCIITRKVTEDRGGGEGFTNLLQRQEILDYTN